MGIQLTARIDKLEAEIKQLTILAKDAEKVIEDFLPFVGQCALQDHALLNDVLVRLHRLKSTEKLK